MGEEPAACKFMFVFINRSRGQADAAGGMTMPFAALLLPFAAATAPAPPPPPPEPPIIVTGHGGIPFISPMGEPIRARTPNEDTLARWFNRDDLNHDGFLTPDELVADAERYFELLDTNHDGQIDPDELAHYEWTIAPEIQVNSRFRHARAPGEAPPKEDADATGDSQHRDQERHDRDRYRMDDGPQGAARYALLNLPEPVAGADTDFDRAVSLQEFRQAALDRFQLLDKSHTGRLTLQALEAMKPVLPANGKWPKRRDDEPDSRIGSGLPPGN
jgi:Ca2+-binding EF-hand superfamily protein